jgi:phosphatidate cytidylyltransferase
MTDPKPAPAGSPKEEPAAPQPAADPTPENAEYQFPSRKARRIAEMTGMIPIIVPKNTAPTGQESHVAKNDADAEAGAEARDASIAEQKTAKPGAAASIPATASESAAPDSGASDKPKLTGEVTATPESAAPDSGASGANASTKPATTEGVIPAPVAAATNEAVAPATARRATAKKSAKKSAKKAVKTAAPEASAKPLDAAPANGVEPVAEVAQEEVAVRPPVSAAAVTGLPLVPVPQGPIASIPDSVSAGKPNRTPKAGRDLPAAISVGVVLLVLVIGSLLFFPLAFVVVATAFVTVGVWEVTRAIGTRGIKAPLTPVMIGALAMPAAAYFAGSEGLLFALVASAGATLLWRSLDPEPGAVKSILAGIFSLMWIPFLLSFVFLMLRGERSPTLGLTLDLGNMNPGVLQVVIMLLLVVANDTFGYLVGVLFGKHPMAPKISPKKSWEGFAGSLGGAILVAIPATVFVLNEHWWVGFALAIGMVLAGTGGDFAESMIKRELGVKDMSNLLPGHGGVMDRLDSILFAAPVAYATFSVLGQF